MGQMMIARLRYIQRFRDRYGRVRLYLRRKGMKPIPLPDEHDPGFLAAYQAALESSAPTPKVSRVSPDGLEALSRSYYASSEFASLASSTQAVYRRIIDGLCRDHGNKPVAMLMPHNVQRLVMEKADTPAAANHLRRTLRALMKHAVHLGIRPDDPTANIGRLKEVGEGAETWTEEDIAAFEARWPVGSKPRLALSLLLYTGQRRSDVVRMGHQHLRNGAIDVRQVKTGARLTIPLHPDLAELLPPKTERLTFLTAESGRAFTPNGFYMRFRAWAEAAGLPAGRSPHGLRKAAARRMAEAGCTPHQIAAVTGHRTLAEIERYTKAANQEHLARQAVVHLGRPQNANASVKQSKNSVKPGRN